MQTPREAFLAMVRGEHADYMVSHYDVMCGLIFPGDRYMKFPDYDAYGSGYDLWGVKWQNMGPNPGKDGSTVFPGFKLFDDMSEWKEHVHFPDYTKFPAAETLKGMKKAMHYDPENKYLNTTFLSGQFERLHHMIGFEDALAAFYEYPDEMHEYMDAFCEYRLNQIDLVYEAVQPDSIGMQDDWGQNNNMFFSPEIWREFIKPNEIRYVEKIHDYGMLYMHHSCGYIRQIIPDLVEIGVDIIEPMMVENGVPELMKDYGKDILFMGGINNRLIEGSKSREERRQEVERAFRECLPLGKWVPQYVSVNEEYFNDFMDDIHDLISKQTLITPDKPNPWE